MDVFGQTRSNVTSHYALITPDTHVHSPLVGWTNASAVVHISPELGSRFTQYTATLEKGAVSAMPPTGVQRFVYVQAGSCSLSLGGKTQTLDAGGFAFLSLDEHELTSDGATLIVFEKRFTPHADFDPPETVAGDAKKVAGEAFMGDPDAQLQTLLPVTPDFDMAVNIFTYQPGATLPQVEIHTMEHGLLMLDGQGVYRLGQDYHPVAAGDVIWMASYCPQWFVAMGKQPASYIYYKDIHREQT